MGFKLDWRAPWKGEDLTTSLHDIAGSVIYGGLQNIDQKNQYEYLNTEIRWIDRCLKNNIPLLGICLGGQLIAHTLGARVAPHDKGLQEFGYYPISPGNAAEGFLPGELHVMQCHEQGFDLPTGALLLAKGENYPNQAFSYGDFVYGLQFHPECTRTTLKRWQSSEWAPWNRPGVQNQEQQDTLAALHDGPMHDWFLCFLQSLFDSSQKLSSESPQ
jgi:GMP synthase (glutamine-hydrolysing)